MSAGNIVIQSETPLAIKPLDSYYINDVCEILKHEYESYAIAHTIPFESFVREWQQNEMKCQR